MRVVVHTCETFRPIDELRPRIRNDRQAVQGALHERLEVAPVFVEEAELKAVGRDSVRGSKGRLSSGFKAT